MAEQCHLPLMFDLSHLWGSKILLILSRRLVIGNTFQVLVLSKVVLDVFEPVAIFYEVNKTMTAMLERQMRSASGKSPTYNSKYREFHDYLPEVEFLQVRSPPSKAPFLPHFLS